MNDDAIPLFMNAHGLKRAEARTLILRYVGTLWRLDPSVGRRGEPVCVVPMQAEERDSAGMQGSEMSHQTRPFDGSTAAEQAQSGRQESSSEKTAPNTDFRNAVFLPGDCISPPVDCPTCDGVGCPECEPERREVFEL